MVSDLDCLRCLDGISKVWPLPRRSIIFWACEQTAVAKPENSTQYTRSHLFMRSSQSFARDNTRTEIQLLKSGDYTSNSERRCTDLSPDLVVYRSVTSRIASHAYLFRPRCRI